MFIEKLWQENPSLVLKAIKKIADMDIELAKELSFHGVDEKGYLKFGVGNINGYCTVHVSDFSFQGSKSADWGGVVNTRTISNSADWMKFMYKVFGKEYAMQYISKRNQEFDKFMAEYEEKYNNVTNTMLDEMGYGNTQTK